MIEVRKDHVLVKVIKEEETRGGIIIPANNKDPFVKADVISVGPDIKDISEGQRIIAMRSMLTPITLDGDEYSLCESKAIIGHDK